MTSFEREREGGRPLECSSGRSLERSSGRSLVRAAWLLVPLALAACRGPAGVPVEPLEMLGSRATPVPAEPDHVAHDVAAAALAGSPADARAQLARLEQLEAERHEGGHDPTGLVGFGQHLVDATLSDDLAYRRASARLLDRDGLDPALRSELEMVVADDPLDLAAQRINESRRARLARDVNAFSEAIGRSITSTAMAPVRLVQAAIGVAIAEHMDDPISVQERQALAEWKQYVETNPHAPETPEIVDRIEHMQRRWFAMKRERSVRAARLALEKDEDDIALVLAGRALAYAPEDGEATKLYREAERRTEARHSARARTLEAPAEVPPDAGDPRGAALARALLDPAGDVEGAARPLLADGDDGPLADEAEFAEAIAAGERGDEARHWKLVARVADRGDAQHPMARHARQLRDDPASNPWRAFEEARVEHVEDQATFVLLGPLAHGARDRDLPRVVEWLLEGPALVSTLGGIPARFVQTAFAGPPSDAPAVYASSYLARHPQGLHAGDARAWLVDHWSDRGDAVRAYAIAREDPGFDAGRLAELERDSAKQMFEAARKQQRRDVRLAMLSELARRHPDTEEARKATEQVRKELEDTTAQSIRISKGFLLENPKLAGPGGLGLRPELLDGKRANGELHPDGVRLIGGQVLEFSLLAPSGDANDPPERVRRRVSEERLSRLVALLEETSLRNALLDPLAEEAPDARRDLYFERARLGIADEPDLRATASSSYAFVGMREKYGMVRSRESILPVELVIQGSFPDLGLGAFPRLRMPKTTPDAVLYR